MNNGVAQEVYCRFSYQSVVQYGKVVDKSILPLDKAPWENGKPAGQKIDLNKVLLLHPTEPKIIIGIGKPFSKGMDTANPYKVVRWFVKPPSSAGSPGQKIVLPELIDKIKVEVELVIIIGKTIKNSNEAEADNAIFGYTMGNDIGGDAASFHERQNEPADIPDPLLGAGLKAGDNFAPYGPFIYRNIDWSNHEKELLITNEDGKEISHFNENTNEMAYSPAKIVSDMSKILTLSPGDVIFCGTAKSFLAKPGDKVNIYIDGIGSFSNEIVK